MSDEPSVSATRDVRNLQHEALSGADQKSRGRPPLRILIVMPLGEQRGGGELMLVHLLKFADIEEATFTVALLEDGPLAEEFRVLGHDVVVIPAGRLREAGRFVTTVRKLSRLAVESDLVLSWMAKGHIYGGSAALRARRPAVWYQLGTTSGDRLDRLATIIPAAGIITLSRAGRDAQARLRPRRAVRLVYPGTEIDSFDPSRQPSRESVRARAGIPADAYLVGIVGRLQRWKGMHLAVEAMPEILQRAPSAHLVIVGGVHALEPGYEADLRDLVESLGLEEKVTLTGLQRHVAEWMHAMDVVLLASDHEPFGIVVIEAMALGRPVVASDQGGPTEIITHGVDGLLFRTGDAGALAEAVLRLFDEPSLAERLGKQARARAAGFAADRFASAVISAATELAYA